MSNWTPAKDLVGAGEHGRARVEQFTVGREDSMMQALRGTHLPPGEYTRLVSGGTLWMSDTPDEGKSNWTFVYEARGRVLVGGLGLGWVLAEVLKKPEVWHVDVIERDPDIIALVEPRIRAAVPEARKLKVLCRDIFDWKPPRGRMWDVIYFDIWADICTDNLKEITRLKRKFARRKRPDGWMGAWDEEHLRYLKRRGM